MRNPCKKRKLQTDKAQGATKCTDRSGTNAIDFFNYYSSQETGKEGEQRMKYKNQMQINQMLMPCSCEKNQFNSNTNNT